MCFDIDLQKPCKSEKFHAKPVLNCLFMRVRSSNQSLKEKRFTIITLRVSAPVFIHVDNSQMRCLLFLDPFHIRLTKIIRKISFGMLQLSTKLLKYFC